MRDARISPRQWNNILNLGKNKLASENKQPFNQWRSSLLILVGQSQQVLLQAVVTVYTIYVISIYVYKLNTFMYHSQLFVKIHASLKNEQQIPFLIFLKQSYIQPLIMNSLQNPLIYSENMKIQNKGRKTELILSIKLNLLTVFMILHQSST